MLVIYTFISHNYHDKGLQNFGLINSVTSDFNVWPSVTWLHYNLTTSLIILTSIEVTVSTVSDRRQSEFFNFLFSSSLS